MTPQTTFDRISDPNQNSYPTPAFLRMARSRRSRNPILIAVTGLLLLILGWRSSAK
ncbi:MAG: hypothetical protein Q9198_008885, partial [Flavoplaca austrocitrina]